MFRKAYFALPFVTAAAGASAQAAFDCTAPAAPDTTGAVMLGDEMIDEASRKMALVISAKGRAAGMKRTSKFEPPEG